MSRLRGFRKGGRRGGGRRVVLPAERAFKFKYIYLRGRVTSRVIYIRVGLSAQYKIIDSFIKNIRMEFPSPDIDIYLCLDPDHAHPGDSQLPPHSKFEDSQPLDFSPQSQILLSNNAPCKRTIATQPSEILTSEKKKVSRQATAKYRDKKRKYEQELEEEVRRLQENIEATDLEIRGVKDSIMEKLTSTTKATCSEENSEIFQEIRFELQKQAEGHQTDLDKLNLLLDTLAYRIGPSGRERQAKLNYNFKNIINTLFPGLHRYLMVTATKGLDFFNEESNAELGWTVELRKNLQLSSSQLEQLRQLKSSIVKSNTDASEVIKKLLDSKQRLREQGLRFDRTENDIREWMDPVQCARWTLLCEKKKYHQDLFLQKANEHFYENEAELRGLKGRKRVHHSDP